MSLSHRDQRLPSFHLRSPHQLDSGHPALLYSANTERKCHTVRRKILDWWSSKAKLILWKPIKRHTVSQKYLVVAILLTEYLTEYNFDLLASDFDLELHSFDLASPHFDFQTFPVTPVCVPFRRRGTATG